MRLRVWLMMVVGAAAVFGGACQQKAPPVVAVVGGVPVTRAAFEEELRRVKAETGDLLLQKDVVISLKASVLNQLIEKQLVLNEAAAYGISVSDAEVEAYIAKVKSDYPENAFEKSAKENFVNLSNWRQRVRDQLIIDKVVDEELGRNLEPDEEELLRYFRSHGADFSKDERVHLRQIVVRNRDEAEALRARIAGGESFAEVARKHSLTPDAEKGGDVGLFAKGEMPPEFNQAFNLNVGELSPVVQSPYGYHLFWVVAKHPPKISQFEEVRALVRERLLKERKENAYRLWIKQLRDQAGVRVFQDEIEKVN